MSPDGSPLPTPWIERLFERLTAIVGSTMATVYAGADPQLVKAEWAEALSGFSAAEVQRGIAATRTRRFAPNLPEFLHLCRPSLDPEIAWFEAANGLSCHQDQKQFAWSHPAVYWAGCEMSFELRNASFSACRRRWEANLSEMFAARTLPPIPDPRANRIENKPSAPLDAEQIRVVRERLAALRQRMTGYATRSEQDDALERAERQALEQGAGL